MKATKKLHEFSINKIWNSIKTVKKNIDYITNLIGSTDISQIGDGTVTGVVNELNSNKLIPGVSYIGYLRFDENGRCNISEHAKDKIILNAFVDSVCPLDIYYINSGAECIAENKSIANQNAYVWISYLSVGS